MISIVTASYNYEQYIKETIQSVLNQTYQDWEMIIVDDCSSDNSINVIKSFNDERIKLFVNEKNLGLKGTVKRGIEEAKCDWIVFLESDDKITPDYLEKKIQIAKKYPEVNLIFNDCEFFGDEKKVYDYNNALKKTRKVNTERHYPSNMFWKFYQSNKIFTFSVVMAKRNELLKLDFNPNLDYLLDWHLWIQMANLGKFYYINEKLTHWRLHKKSYINVSQHKSPRDLQIPSYLYVFSKTFNPLILLFIPFSNIIWHAREIKKRIKHILISYKRQTFGNKNSN